MADVGVEAFKHNLWANLALLDASASMSDDDLDATAPGTYGTVRSTLLHMFSAEGRYVGEFKGKSDDMLAETLPFPGFEKLRSHAVASGTALLEIAQASPADLVLKGTYRGQPYEMPASVMLIHAINHATEHRAHVVSILSQRGVETPRMDGIGYFQVGAHA